MIVYFSDVHVQLLISYYNCIHAWLASEINYCSSNAKKFLVATGYFFCDKKFLPVIRNIFMWQKISSYDKKFLTVAWNYFIWQEVSFCDKKFFPVTGHFCLWQEISSCDMKCLPVTRNFFLWQEISFCDKKFLPLIRASFLWQEISSCGNWSFAVPKCLFLWQENISRMLCVIGRIPSFNRKYWNTFEVKFVPKQCELLQKFRGSLKISWEPGSLAPG